MNQSKRTAPSPRQALEARSQAAYEMRVTGDRTAHQTVIIPANAFVEAGHELDPHVAVHLHATSHTPAIRIRVGDGPLGQRIEAARALKQAAAAMLAQLEDDPEAAGL